MRQEMPPHIITEQRNFTIEFCNLSGYTIIPIEEISDDLKFTPEILYKECRIDGCQYIHKIYKCPVCESISGIDPVLVPNALGLFRHHYGCANKFKYPFEEPNCDLPSQ